MGSKKTLSITSEVIVLTILTVGVYAGIMMLFLRPPECIVGNTLYFLTGDGFSSKIPLVAILAFDAMWLATIKFWPLRNVYIKIVLTLLLFAFSAAFVTSYIVAYMLRDFHW
jgi:hypothetical protein